MKTASISGVVQDCPVVFKAGILTKLKFGQRLFAAFGPDITDGGSDDVLVGAIGYYIADMGVVTLSADANEADRQLLVCANDSWRCGWFGDGLVFNCLCGGRTTRDCARSHHGSGFQKITAGSARRGGFLSDSFHHIPHI